MIVSKDGGLKNVVVEILVTESDGANLSWNHPKGGDALKQKGCQFSPSLLVMPSGADLTVINDDPLGHKVNSGQWNEQQAGGGAQIVRP